MQLKHVSQEMQLQNTSIWWNICFLWTNVRDDTIVIAAPDHDSGGFIVNNLENAVNSIINNEPVDTNFVKAGRLGHTAQEVPFWLYAPSWVRDNLLED